MRPQAIVRRAPSPPNIPMNKKRSFVPKQKKTYPADLRPSFFCYAHSVSYSEREKRLFGGCCVCYVEMQKAEASLKPKVDSSKEMQE